MLILPSADGTGGTGTHPGTRLYWAWPPRWRDEATRGERFRAQITANSRGHAVSTIPFDPDQAGGPKAVPQVSGTVHGCRGRVTIAPGDSGGACTRNPARMRQTGLAAGSAAIVERAPDAPPRAGLAGDSGAARAANPALGPASARWRSSTAGGLPAVHRCDDPPAGPARVAYRRGRRPARGRGQRTATAGSGLAGHTRGTAESIGDIGARRRH